MKIHYANSQVEGGKIIIKLKDIIINNNCKDVCDVGGGANPMLAESFVEKNALRYTLLDISQTELDKAPAIYNKLSADILLKEETLNNRWDFMFSRALAEHMKDGKLFHQNIFNCLKPGGHAFHAFPTLYSIPFVANKLIPEKLAAKILDLVAPRDKYQQAKFPAYYDWCFGPTPAMLRKLASIGYEIVDYQGLFGHLYYLRLPPLHNLSSKLSSYLIDHPIPYMTSYAHVLLKKPE